MGLVSIISKTSASSSMPLVTSPGGVNTSTVSSVSASETTGARFADQYGSTHTTITVRPTFAGGSFPCSVSIFLNQGSGYVFSGTFVIQAFVNTAILGANSIGSAGNPLDNGIWVPTNTGGATWDVACIAGIYTGPAVPTSLPTGAKLCSFSIAAVGACPATDVTSASFLTDSHSSQIEYGLTGPGVYTWNFYEMQMTLPSSDPNFWFAAFTVQKGWNNSGTWTPAPDYEGVERQFTDSATVTGTYGPTGQTFSLNGGTSPINGVQYPNWTFPPVTNPDGTTNNYRTFRIKIYAYSKLGFTATNQYGTATLQTCWPSSADHFDLTPTSQPAALDLTMANPTTLGNGLGQDGSSRIIVKTGSGTTIDGSGNVALNYGAALGDDGTGKAAVKITGPLFTNVSNQLNISLASDFVVSGGALTQNIVNLAKAVNFDTEFTLSGGTFAINSIAVNKLTAGSALFAGTATFASTSGPEVQIGSTGITLADNYSSPVNTVAVNSGGVSIGHSSYTVQATASGIGIYGPSGSLTATSGGIVITNGSNSIQVAASGITIYGPSGSLMATSGGIVISNGSSSVTVSSSSVSIVRGSLSSPTISAGSITGTSISITATSSGISNTVSIATSNPNVITITSSNGYSTYFNASSLQQTGGTTGSTQLTAGELYFSSGSSYAYMFPTQIEVFNGSGAGAFMTPSSFSVTGVVTCQGISVNSLTIINSSGGINVGRYNGIGARGINPYDSSGTSYTGQDATVYNPVGFLVNGSSFYTLKFVGGVLVTWY